MEDLFKTISKGNFEPFDAFICFISSHGNEGGILGSDGQTIPAEAIVDNFTNKGCTLVNKPKLFFTQNCRGVLKATRVTPNDDDEAGNDDEAVMKLMMILKVKLIAGRFLLLFPLQLMFWLPIQPLIGTKVTEIGKMGHGLSLY